MEESEKRYRTDLVFLEPVIADYDESKLFHADPKCGHEVVAQWSGVACRKCSGWFCY